MESHGGLRSSTRFATTVWIHDSEEQDAKILARTLNDAKLMSSGISGWSHSVISEMLHGYTSQGHQNSDLVSRPGGDHR